MKYACIVFLTGFLATSGSLAPIVLAECGPPSREEMETQRAAMFAEADADKSNTLSLSEFATFTKLFEAARAQHLFTCLDANGDGQVSAEELATHRPPHGHHPPPPF